MLDICTMTIVRDGEDYIGQCLAVVAPHVKRMKVAIDGRSKDRTGMIVLELASVFPHIEVSTFSVQKPSEDLVAMRNSQLGFPEKWGFILDSDEYHQDIASYELGEEDAYGFQCWAVWNETHAHHQSSNTNIGRIFKNHPDVVWRGRWGKETLFLGDKKVFGVPPMLPYRYTHFTHVKKDHWRKEMNQNRIADSRHLIKMPENVIHLIQKIHEGLPFVPRD